MGDRGLGTGDRGLGIGGWGLGIRDWGSGIGDRGLGMEFNNESRFLIVHILLVPDSKHVPC